MKFLTVLLPAISAVHACQREHVLQRENEPLSLLIKRQTTDFPPALTLEEATLVKSFDNVTISQWSYYYTHGLHVAGTNKSMAQWTADRWAENGFVAGLAQYYVYLNYPVSHSLLLTLPDGTVHNVNLEEDGLTEDPTTTYPNRVPTFHGYSFSGIVEAEYIYVGRGQQVDFDRLLSLGVNLTGKIALARYGGPFRGLKVKNAQAHGMIGCVIFTDTADDGLITEANGYAAYPHGPARNPSSVQRGSVQFLSTYPGDPTTPGYASKEGSPRASTDLTTPRIPSLPISWLSAQPLIQALDGYGPTGRVVNRTNWVGALNASYSTGPAPGKILTLQNQMRDTLTWIWDAVGYINGTDYPDEVLVIGNHRDAWIIGGAADPNSGSAIMIELSKAFNALLATGWKPKRTILLGSWDAEEYGLLGSTEFVEEHLPWLTTTGVTYLNVDVGTSGPDPDLSCTPDLHRVATDTMKKVAYPYRGLNNVTLYDVWYALTKGEIGVLGSGSDYTSFLHAAGMSSLDVGANPGRHDPIYHYHSNYDSYAWMTRFGDPEFGTHKVMGQYLTLLAYTIASSDILPLEPTNYGAQMTFYLTNLEVVVANAERTTNGTKTLDLDPLRRAIESFNASATALQALVQSNPTKIQDVMVINSKLRDYQRGFISQGGLPGREFYKHVVFAPGVDTGYAPVTYPGITEALQLTTPNFTLAQEWVGRTSRAIEVAAGILTP